MINPIYSFFIQGQVINLFQYTAPDAQIGYEVASTDGNTYPNPNWNSSGFIAISGGNRYKPTEKYGVAFYNDRKQYISGYSPLSIPEAKNSMSILSPKNARYMRISVLPAMWQTTTLYEYQSTKPIYKDDLAKEYELETNQKFYRAKLSGKISFIRNDYDFIRSQPFATKFILFIYQSNDLGQSWKEYYKGKFMNTDCEFDEDNKKIQLQPDTLDGYNDTLAGLEKEYNLIQLAPEINSVQLTKRPLIQLYIPGDNIISCYLGGVYFEQDANATTNRDDLIYKYWFSLCNLLKEINVTTNGTPNVNGLYTGSMSIGTGSLFSGNLYPTTTNGYYIHAQQEYHPPFFNGVSIEIRRSLDNVVMFRYSATVPNNTPWDNAVFDAAAVAGSGSTGSAHCEMATYSVYARYLLNVTSISGEITNPLPEEDIVDYNRNYRYAIGYAINVASISNNYSTTPTQWGRRDDGTYFMPPYSFFGQEYYPIARSTWRYASIWFGFYLFDDIIEVAGRQKFTLRDAYPIASCISVLLKQFAPGITHEATPEYSQFLYSSNNPISGDSFRLFISQKSNVKIGDYDQPAQKAPITLQQLTNMLRDCFRAFWYIEDGKFKIEHILWFRNGGSYSSDAVIGIDLTELINVRNDKILGFNTSKWSFDKVDMPERYQFKWMEDCTKGFEGYPIDVISEYVTAGKVEEVNISNFTSDVDYILLNPTAISDDGFVLMAANIANLLRIDFGNNSTSGGQGILPGTFALSGGNGYIANVEFYTYGIIAGVGQLLFFDDLGGFIVATTVFDFTTSYQLLTLSTIIPNGAARIGFYNSSTQILYVTILRVYIPGLFELPILTENVGNVKYIMQNGYLSMIKLQPDYYVYDLPARDVKINNQSVFVEGIERKKKQTLSFPTYDDPNPMQLVKTPIGSGQVDKFSITLCSRNVKATLKYDTE